MSATKPEVSATEQNIQRRRQSYQSQHAGRPVSDFLRWIEMACESAKRNLIGAEAGRHPETDGLRVELEGIAALAFIALEAKPEQVKLVLPVIEEKERAGLRDAYPLLHFDFTRTGSVNVTDPDIKSVWNFPTDLSHLKRHERLREMHQKLAIQRRLRTIYSDLWVTLYDDQLGQFVRLWVMRTNSAGKPASAEVMPLDPKLYLDDQMFHPTLATYQAEAARAKENGWFFCTGHLAAELDGEGRYHYGPGRYCKQYGDANPEHRAAARRERYD